MIERALALEHTKRAGVEGKGGKVRGGNAGELEEGGRRGSGEGGCKRWIRSCESLLIMKNEIRKNIKILFLFLHESSFLINN